MMEDEDFEFQLQQEALEATKKKENDAKNVTTSENSHIYRDQDGTEFEWDHTRKAWFPKINDDFIAQYQAQYGNFEETTAAAESTVEPTSSEKNSEDSKELEDSSETNAKDDKLEAGETSDQGAQGGQKRKQPEKEPQWFEVDDEHNTNVYVSNLPSDITDDEFVELMKKCGLIMKDER